MLTYSIVIPCYCSARWLEELLDRIEPVMMSVGEPFEVLLVNDASPDATWGVIDQLARRHSWVRGIDLHFNTGQFRATMCGLERAAGKFIILMDDDLQHPPEEIPKLINAMRERPELDCVMGAYEVKEHDGVRNLGSRLVSYLNVSLYGKPQGIEASSFRILKRDLAQAILLHRTVNPILGPLIYQSTQRIGNVTVAHSPRTHGSSGYGLRRLFTIAVGNYLAASTFPLRVVSAIGLLSATTAAVLGAYYLVAYLSQSIQVPGFATLVLLMIFFGGTTLFSVGLLGEYMLRLLAEARGRPRYVIRREAGGDVDSTSGTFE